MELIFGDMDSIVCEGIEDFRIVDVICCLWGKGIPIGQTIWQYGRQGMKSRFLILKTNILWDHRHMANSITYFGSFSIPGIAF